MDEPTLLMGLKSHKKGGGAEKKLGFAQRAYIIRRMETRVVPQIREPAQLHLFDHLRCEVPAGADVLLRKKPKKTERVNRGKATNDLVHSAYQASNDTVFPMILELYVPGGSQVADITYGKGVFWCRVDISKKGYPTRSS